MLCKILAIPSKVGVAHQLLDKIPAHILFFLAGVQSRRGINFRVLDPWPFCVTGVLEIALPQALILDPWFVPKRSVAIAIRLTSNKAFIRRPLYS
jgi:hypothetical protein